MWLFVEGQFELDIEFFFHVLCTTLSWTLVKLRIKLITVQAANLINVLIAKKSESSSVIWCDAFKL